jgi:hypothetical protein
VAIPGRQPKGRAGMRRRSRRIYGWLGAGALLAVVAGALSAPALAGGSDEFKVKREAVFEFAQAPQVTGEGDRVTITFESKGWCDATVAIEDETGRILRHLASGVLGPKAPAPFRKNSRRQTLVWDGKDDRGAYVDEKDRCTVRVSLGLKPRFERTLFWHPGKPSAQGGYSSYSGQRLAVAPAPEGVYVYDSGHGVDHVRLFDHDGRYLQTIYPFPSAEIENVKGVDYHTFPDGTRIPIKPNWFQSTFLKSGNSCWRPTYRDGRYQGYQSRGIATGGISGSGGDELVAAGGRVALIGRRLSRLVRDGDGRLHLHGPSLSISSDKAFWKPNRGHRSEDPLSVIRAKRAALSPDGRWLYLSMYNETFPGTKGAVLWRHMVRRIRYDGEGELENFAGNSKPGDGPGEFHMPADVACDAQGRVYVADHLNDRVQVFGPAGKQLKSIAVRRPVKINVHPETGAIFVFSWGLPLSGSAYYGGTRLSVKQGSYNPTRFFQLTRFSPLDKGAKQQATWDLHRPTRLRGTRCNLEHYAAVDFWTDPLRIWITAPSPPGAKRPRGRGILVLALKNNEWRVERDLLAEAVRAVTRVRPPAWNRQRLYVNPADGMLYLVEGDSSHGKACRQIVRIDPDTGRVREIDLPMSTEDLAFDLAGHAYLRTSDMTVRYEPAKWREVPFDYGEQRDKHHFGNGGGERSARVISGAVFPGNKGFHQGGMHVSASGHIVISALYDNKLGNRKEDVLVHSSRTGYKPLLYPGRRWAPGSRLGCMLVHIFDRRGKLIHCDAVPGLHQLLNGTGIDARGDVYLLSPSPRVVDGQRHFNDHAGTLMKFTPGEGRVLAAGSTPVPLADRPDRPPDLHLPTAWVEGAHWLYPGVGWGGQNYSSGCSCPNCRFALDYYARSFTPEIDRYNVGVVDSSGNLILRVGQYGNVDDGIPLVKKGGPPNPRSIGGDETALFFAPYVGVYTDRRLFIADPGNARIVSVKFGYHTERHVALKDVANTEENDAR